MRRLRIKLLLALISMLPMAFSCEKAYYDRKYENYQSETAEIHEYLEGDWELVHQHMWGYDKEFHVENNVVDYNSFDYYPETGEDNGPVSRTASDYIAVRFEDGLVTILASGDPEMADFIGIPMPYHISDGNKIHGSIFYGDVAEYLTIKMISKNKMQLLLHDLGYGKEYDCHGTEHDGVIFRHNGDCTLMSCFYCDWFNLTTWKRINKVTIVNPPEGWMTYVKDAALLSQVSIPGTHASATYYGLNNDMTSITQRVKIEGQWDAGVRAFELAVSDGGGLSFMSAQLDRSFRDIIKIFQEKLLVCKQDAAIVFVRPSADVSDGDMESWREYIGEVVDELDEVAAVWTPEMTMRDARGRIVFVMEESFTWNGKTEETPGALVVRSGNEARIFSKAADGEEIMYIQDKSEISSADKLSSIFESMKLSMTFNDIKENYWMINSLSLYDEGYIDSAVDIVPMVCSFLNGDEVSATASGNSLNNVYQKTEEGPLGIVMMDFAAEESDELSAMSLTEMIIQNNFKYTMKTR